MSLKKGPGRRRIARSRGIFDELVVMILILILNITKVVNRKLGIGLNLWELPRKIPDWGEFPHVFRENPGWKGRILPKLKELFRFFAKKKRRGPKPSLEFKGNSYVDLAKRSDLNPLGKTAGNVTNVG